MVLIPNDQILDVVQPYRLVTGESFYVQYLIVNFMTDLILPETDAIPVAY